MRSLWFCFSLILLSTGISAQSIIITEIFADPKPSKGLPETEFVEIYNTTNEDISLSGYKLTYGNTISQFPDSVIKSHQYAILVRATFSEDYQDIAFVIAMPRLTLNNNGAALRILDSGDNEIHFVAYSTDWYTPGFNKGYSLEMVDKDYPCAGKSNWASSTDPTGATPGKANSVNGNNPDNNLPELNNFSFNENQITLVFSKNMALDFVSMPEHFEFLASDLEIEEINFELHTRNIIEITLNKEVPSGLILNIYNPTDCSGNIGEDIQITLIRLAQPKMGDIQISEILFNPKTGGQDFVELYNKGEDPFSLKNWFFGNVNNKGEQASFRLISAYELIIEPGNYIAFTTDKAFLEENYPNTGQIIEIPLLPAYNNDAGTVLLFTPDSTLFDSFSYTEKMHAELIANPKGVSLEKTSFNTQKAKWVSAAADAGYATPGLLNSQMENSLLEEYFMADPIVFNPYQESDHSVTNLNYKLSQHGNYATIVILDRTGKKVKNIGSNLLLGTSGKIKWDGTDDYGQLLPVGYYVFSINIYNTSSKKNFIAKTVIGSY